MKPVGIRIPLLDLDPRFVANVAGPGNTSYVARVSTLAAAHGVSFLCPKCYHAAGRRIEGVHRVTCWFEGRVPDEMRPGPGRWAAAGAGFEDLTFVPTPRESRTSVKLEGGCRWHGHVVGGHATLVPA